MSTSVAARSASNSHKYPITRLFCLALLLFSCAIVASAQSTVRNFDGSETPTGLKQGSPAGSFALSGIETVDPNNGRLNASIPLLKIGGRGGASYVMTQRLTNPGWTINNDLVYYFAGGAFQRQTWRSTITEAYSIKPSLFNGAGVNGAGLGPGFVEGRRAARNPKTCGTGYTAYEDTFTYFQFTAPGGTEHALYDVKNIFVNHPCQSGETAYRGKVFSSSDGTGITFISDEDIWDLAADGVLSSMETQFAPSGYLFMPDGTRYRVEKGLITWIRDRNGNRLDFTYDSFSRVSQIKDSINRVVTVQYDYQDSAPYGLCTRIVYKGFSGAERIIRIATTTQSIQQVNLFPDFPGGVLVSQTKTTYVWLPDGRRYACFYNPYGEIQRIELPTGGATEYDYSAGVTGAYSSGQIGDSEYLTVNTPANWPDELPPPLPTILIYRRLIERRIYPDGGTGASYKSRTTYSRPESASCQAGYSYCTFSQSTSYVEEVSYGSSPEPLSIQRHYYHGFPARDMYAALSIFAGNADPTEGKERQTEELSGQTVLRRVVRTWQGPVLTASVTTLVDTNQVSKQTFEYDQYLNQTHMWEYDYGSGAPGPLIRHTETTYLTTNNGTSYDTINPSKDNPDANATYHIRGLPIQQSVYAGGVEEARTTYEYDGYTPDANHNVLVDRPGISGLCDSITITAVPPTQYSSGYNKHQCVLSNPTSQTVRGNVTSVKRWILTPSLSPISTYSQYDVAGNVVKTIDGRGYATNIYYDDRFGGPDGNLITNNSPTELASASQSSFAFPTAVTNTLGQSTHSKYDYYLGGPVDGQDVNGVVSIGYYDDLLDRPTQVVRAFNVPTLKNQTSFTYNDSLRTITATSDQNSYGDNKLKTEGLYDGLGRTVETRSYETSTAYIATRTEYDALGRVSQMSNPYRLGDTVYWKTNEYDALGRITAVTTPDGSKTYSFYYGNQVLVTDQAGKQRMSQTNGVGNLTDVWEITTADQNTVAVSFPHHPEVADVTSGYKTHYDHDALGNLTKVTQGGQARTFEYDSLSRLRSATNPESGKIDYSYDNNGNLLTKTDARSIITTNAYDPLSRVQSRSYSDGTPAVTYTYDEATVPYSKGRLTQVSSSVSTTRYTEFDALRRIKASSQTTDGQTYSFSYTYDLAGNLRTETYPSGRTVTTSYDDAARVKELSGQQAGGTAKTYASSFNYTAYGAFKSVQLGNGLWEHTNFNSRLQPTEIGLGTSSAASGVLKLTYDYGTTDNNGNARSQSIDIPGFSRTQSYTYDSLNRLKTAEEDPGTQNTWKQTFSYDRFGNRRFDAANTTSNLITENPTISTANNRLDGYGYDLAGNMTTKTSGHQMTYDAESRMKSYNDPTDALGYSTFGYDGDGRRVKKVVANGTKTTIFVYDAMGKLASEYSNEDSTTSGTSFLTTDTLGSTRVVTDQAGTVKGRHDYLPFGEELLGGGRTVIVEYGQSDGVRQKFTGYERDAETRLDYANARYYASVQGRFTSVDPFNIILHRQNAPQDEKAEAAYKEFIGNPQRWNRYSYAVNAPTVFTDPTGLDIMIIENGPTSGNPIGHTAIAITGRGVYSMGNAERTDRQDNKKNILGGDVKKYILRELSRRDTTLTIIKTTPEQDAAAAAKMEDIAQSRGKLTQSGIITDNCSVRVNEALDAAGIPGTVEPDYQPNIPGTAGVRAHEYNNGANVVTVIKVPQNSNLTEADRLAIRPFEPQSSLPPPGAPGGTPVVTRRATH